MNSSPDDAIDQAIAALRPVAALYIGVWLAAGAVAARTLSGRSELGEKTNLYAFQIRAARRALERLERFRADAKRESAA